MYFNFQISTITLALLCAAFVCLLIILTIYLLRVHKVTTFRRKCDAADEAVSEDKFRPASIVVYSQDEADQLAELMPQLLGQEYPAPFEVIVVNEGESVDVRDVVAALQLNHPNLYLTFTPDGARNLSRKKLALTLGVKAAKYDVVVLTTAVSIIDSPLWLRRMMRNFNENPDVEVVLGASVANPEDDTAFGAKQRVYDSTVDAVKWLSAAISGNPYRGTEYNLAYLKSTFFRNKGFSRSLNLHFGDDDIFISEIANGDNTAVELSEESIVKVRYGNDPRLYKERALRHIFTEHRIKHRARFLMGFSGALHLLLVAALAAAIAFDYNNIFTISLSALILIMLFVLDIVIWRGAMQALGARCLMLTIPYYAITRPFRRGVIKIQSYLGRQKEFTWN